VANAALEEKNQTLSLLELMMKQYKTLVESHNTKTIAKSLSLLKKNYPDTWVEKLVELLRAHHFHQGQLPIISKDGDTCQVGDNPYLSEECDWLFYGLTSLVRVEEGCSIFSLQEVSHLDSISAELSPFSK